MKLKDWRKKKGYTQEKLSQILNIRRTAISAWESGIAYPRMYTARKLSVVFGITIDELFKSIDESKEIKNDETRADE